VMGANGFSAHSPKLKDCPKTNFAPA